MTPATALAIALTRTFVLRGRASRMEFWMLYAAATALTLAEGNADRRR